MTLVTIAQTVDSTVSYGRMLIEYDNTASPTLNTHLTAEVTCDGGSNWASAHRCHRPEPGRADGR